MKREWLLRQVVLRVVDARARGHELHAAAAQGLLRARGVLANSSEAPVSCLSMASISKPSAVFPLKSLCERPGKATHAFKNKSHWSTKPSRVEGMYVDKMLT